MIRQNAVYLYEDSETRNITVEVELLEEDDK